MRDFIPFWRVVREKEGKVWAWPGHNEKIEKRREEKRREVERQKKNQNFAASLKERNQLTMFPPLELNTR